MTNWQDTVLTDEQMAKALDTSRDEYWDSSPLIGVVDYPERVIQAEATWKAVMQEKCFESYEMGVADGRRKGMKEVMEWMNTHSTRVSPVRDLRLDEDGLWHLASAVQVYEDEWQAFKEEKGL